MHVQGLDVGRGDPASDFLERGAAGEERCGVAVFAETEKDQIETRRGICGSEKIAQLLLVVGRRAVGVFLAGHTVNVLWRNFDFAEQRLVNHPVIALRMVRRHTALVAPKEMHAIPDNSRAKLRRGEKRIERFRGGAAGERYGETTAGLDRCGGERNELRCGLACRLVSVAANYDSRLSHRKPRRRSKRRRASRLVDSIRLGPTSRRETRYSGPCR